MLGYVTLVCLCHLPFDAADMLRAVRDMLLLPHGERVMLLRMARRRLHSVTLPPLLFAAIFRQMLFRHDAAARQRVSLMLIRKARAHTLTMFLLR